MELNEASFWTAPNPGFHKVNFDRTFLDTKAKAGAGIIIHNEDGLFLYAEADLGGCWSMDAAKCGAAQLILSKALKKLC